MFVTKLQAQVIEVSDKIILTNPNDSLRKVKDVKNPKAETDAVRSEFFINGMSQFAVASGTNDTINLTIYPSITNLVPGVTLNFISPLANSKEVKIKVNGINAYFSLHKKGTLDLDTADLISGQMLSIVYDGTHFQVISQLNKSCPNNFIKVTREYCIQQVENTAVYFWNAVRNCGDQNARVCTWGEWYYACFNSTQLGLTDMTGNWEWIDGGGNALGFTTPGTNFTGLQVGQTSCTEAISSIIDTTHTNVRAQPKPYHCCYSLK
jgi:hypothetical protein